MFLNFYICILYIERLKKAKKVWSKDIMHEKTFRLSSRTPHAYKIS